MGFFFRNGGSTNYVVPEQFVITKFDCISSKYNVDEFIFISVNTRIRNFVSFYSDTAPRYTILLYFNSKCTHDISVINILNI